MSEDTITTESTASVLDTDRLGRRLHEHLARSEAQLVQLESVLSDMLRGNDTIQEDQDTTRLVVEALREDVRQIHAALSRLSNGTYGRCVACAASIAPERLEAIPTASHCARCA